ncbi:MAG: spore maturation protein A [Oscillospiraceae bacterium]|nr:spore maturation protein A [Oscillospiraceae bacterium]
MLLGILLLVIYLAGTLYALWAGTAAEAGAAVMEGAQTSVAFLLQIGGGICLWSGVMELLERCGATAGLARLLRPLLRRLFPRASGDPEALTALTENISADLLGLGNAATPAGIRAARRMVGADGRATDELCLLVVLNTASLQLLPTGIATVRAAAGATAAFDILPAVWISSAASVCAGLAAAALLRRACP